MEPDRQPLQLGKEAAGPDTIDEQTKDQLTSSPPLSLLTSISIPSRPVSAGKLTAGPMEDPSTELLNWTTTVGALGMTGAGTSSDGPESLTRLGGGSLQQTTESVDRATSRLSGSSMRRLTVST